jgi:hypothetical protein
MALLCQHCANVVMPTGGLKDETSPVVVSSEPQNFSTCFAGNRIDIVFDEYVVLENANQNVLISPPLNAKPDIKLNNKVLTIKFKENLAKNTTYTINFGNAIKDLHEGNPFTNYVFSFSTGSVLDSLSLGGEVLTAFDKKPVEDVYVTLYYQSDSSLIDSLPLTTKPNYITKTDKEGNFRFTGLADKEYLVFALKDVNSNLYFDMPNEEVAFLDTLVEPVYIMPEKKAPMNAKPENLLLNLDTLSLKSLDDIGLIVMDSLNHLVLDTLKLAKSDSAIRHYADSLMQITPAFQEQRDLKAMNLSLYMFTEVDSTQMLLEKKLVGEGLLRFVFRHPAKGVIIQTPEILPDSFRIIPVHSMRNDTILWYFTPKVKDSLWVQVKYDTIINDSIQMSLKVKESAKPRGRKEESVQRLIVSNNLVKGVLPPEQELQLRFKEPIASYAMKNTNSISVDSILFSNSLEFNKVDEFGFVYQLKTMPAQGENYSIIIPDSVFYGISGLANDTIKIDFRNGREDEYGNLFITVAPPDGVQKVIVQLMDDKSKVLDKKIITKNQELEFRYLAPAKYKLRAILDVDGNEVWSTGNFHRKILPEIIIDNPQDFEIRAGWDIDLDEPWKL